MIHRLFRRFWTHFLIAFDDNYTLEGFERTPKKFDLPKNFTWLDSNLKRKLTICNLFANQNQSIRNIARVLEVDWVMWFQRLLRTASSKNAEPRPKSSSRKDARNEFSLCPWQDIIGSDVVSRS